MRLESIDVDYGCGHSHYDTEKGANQVRNANQFKLKSHESAVSLDTWSDENTHQKSKS